MIKKYFQNKMIKAFDDSERSIAATVRFFSQSKKVKILDVGCADGKRTLNMLQGVSDYVVYGIDMLDHEKIEPVIRYTKTDLAATFPYEDNFFDIVISNQVIEHFLDKDYFLGECHRILKDGGLFICCTDNISSWDNILSLLLGQEPLSQHTGSKFITSSFLSPYFMQKIDDPKGNLYMHKNVCSYFGLQRLFRIAGFKDLEVKTYGNICKLFELLFPVYNRIIIVSSIKKI